MSNNAKQGHLNLTVEDINLVGQMKDKEYLLTITGKDCQKRGPLLFTLLLNRLRGKGHYAANMYWAHEPGHTMKEDFDALQESTPDYYKIAFHGHDGHPISELLPLISQTLEELKNSYEAHDTLAELVHRMTERTRPARGKHSDAARTTRPSGTPLAP